MENALSAIALMITRAQKAQEKFAEGSSHYSLQENRINALIVASRLIESQLSGNSCELPRESLEKALAPINSLISKSEKAQQKVGESSWQYAMLQDNLRALHIALPLLQTALKEDNQ